MKAILFDLDNTLTDRKATIRSYSRIFIEDFKSHLLSECTLVEVAELLILMDQNGYRGHSGRSRDISEASFWTTRVHARMLEDHWKAWIPNNPEPMKDLAAVLEAVSTLTDALGIITNGSSDAQRTKIKRLKIDRYFRSIVVSEEVGAKKPDPQIFEHSIKELNVSAEDCIFIGDDPVNDYDGASQFGMTPIWISKGRDWNLPHQPAYQIKELPELPNLIQSILNKTL